MSLFIALRDEDPTAPCLEDWSQPPGDGAPVVAWTIMTLWSSSSFLPVVPFCWFTHSLTVQRMLAVFPTHLGKLCWTDQKRLDVNPERSRLET